MSDGKTGAGFKDHFSRQAQGYAKSRPVYPEALFAYLATLPAGKTSVWDCGTGSGQAALALAAHFPEVIATDASPAQLRQARRHPAIKYVAAKAENPPLRDASIDLVTVAQALHWFDFQAFFAEALRVGATGSIFAAWGYGNCRVTPAVDAVYDRLYEGILGPYWPGERRHIEAGYRTIPMPFPSLTCPDFEMVTDWNSAQYLDYLATWSAVQAYRKTQGSDPLDLVRDELARAWEAAETVRPVRWPLALRIGRIRA